MSDLTKLPNIGKKLEAQLNQIGITNKEEFAQIGSKEAWKRIKAFDPSA